MGAYRIGHLVTFAAALSMASGFDPIFPSLRGAGITSSVADNVATITPTLPAHQIGDLIMVVVGYRTDGIGQKPNTASAGWLEAYDTANGAGDNGIAIYTKMATSAAEALVVNLPSEKHTAAAAYVIQDASGAIEVAYATSSGDPPSLTPSWGTQKTKWFVASSCSTTVGTAPAGFSDQLQETTQANAKLMTCHRDGAVATLDPATTGATGTNIAVTIAVRPMT